MNRNHFTKIYSTKSDQELRSILESLLHVDDAKRAAKWILEERGEKTDYQPPKQALKNANQKSPKLWGFGNEKIDKIQMLVLGVVLIFMAFYFNFSNLMTTQNSLIALRGTIKSSEILVENVSFRGRFGIERKSKRATLYFSLYEHQKLFELVENIGQNIRHEKFERFSKSLTKSHSIAVWINKSDRDKFNPKVFQIDVNERTILDFETVKSRYNGIFVCMMLIGVGLLSFTLFSKYPKQMRKIIGLQ